VRVPWAEGQPTSSVACGDSFPSKGKPRLSINPVFRI